MTKRRERRGSSRSLRAEWEKLIRRKWDLQLIHQLETEGILDGTTHRYLEARARAGEPLLDFDRCMFLLMFRHYQREGVVERYTLAKVAAHIGMRPHTIERLFKPRAYLGPRELRGLLRLLKWLGLRPEQINAPIGLMILGDRPAFLTETGDYPGYQGSAIHSLLTADAPLATVRFVEQWIHENQSL